MSEMSDRVERAFAPAMNQQYNFDYKRGDAMHRGCMDYYADFEAELRRAIDSRRPFCTGWHGAKHEIISINIAASNKPSDYREWVVTYTHRDGRWFITKVVGPEMYQGSCIPHALVADMTVSCNLDGVVQLNGTGMWEVVDPDTIEFMSGYSFAEVDFPVTSRWVDPDAPAIYYDITSSASINEGHDLASDAIWAFCQEEYPETAQEEYLRLENLLIERVADYVVEHGGDMGWGVITGTDSNTSIEMPLSMSVDEIMEKISEILTEEMEANDSFLKDEFRTVISYVEYLVEGGE